MPVQQVAVLSNPKSTQNKRVFDRLCQILENSQNIFHFELDSVDSIPAALREFSRTSPALIVVNGGDGTVQATLSSMVRDRPFENPPPIAVLPSGQTNMIAEDLGTGGNPEKVLRRIIEVAQDGSLKHRIVRRHLIEMDLGDGSEHRFGMFFGAAGVVNGIHYCRSNIYPMKMPNILSHPLALIVMVFSGLTGGKRQDSATYSRSMRIVMPAGGILEGHFFSVIVTTLDRLLLGLRPYGLHGPGTLGFSAIEHRPRAVIGAVRALLTGRFGRATLFGVSTRRVNEIRITGKDPVTLDGEIYDVKPGQTVTLKGNDALDFLSLRKKI